MRPTSADSPALECTGLTAGYADHPDVIMDIDLRLDPGALIGVVGESGCGKSTMMYALLGHSQGGLMRSAGVIRYQGADITHLTPRDWLKLRGPELAMVFQSPAASFDPLMRVGRQFTESVRRHTPQASPRACRAAARQLLSRLRFDSPDAVLDAYPFELSGGMAQRAAIAMALLSEPRVLLADEPASALDVRAQKEVLDLLGETASEFGTAVLFVSHQINLVRRLVSHVHILAEGRFVESGPAGKVLSHSVNPYTRRLLDAVPRLDRGHAA